MRISTTSREDFLDSALLPQVDGDSGYCIFDDRRTQREILDWEHVFLQPRVALAEALQSDAQQGVDRRKVPGTRELPARDCVVDRGDRIHGLQVVRDRRTHGDQ